MKTHRLFYLLICSQLACGTPTTDPGGNTPNPPEVIERTACDRAIDGPAWHDGPPVESAASEVDGRLAAMDFSVLGDEIDISALPAMFRGQIAYALDVPPNELGDTLDRQATAARGKLGEVVLGALLEGRAGVGFDFTFFRQGLQRYYTCSKALPINLDDLRSELGIQLSAPNDVTPSAAKCVTRRLAVDDAAGYYQAETIVDGEVRETEILLSKSRVDGNLDFVVYGADGRINDRSRFPTIGQGQHVTVGAPYACMTCHFDADEFDSAWSYRVLYPDGTGPCRQ